MPLRPLAPLTVLLALAACGERARPDAGASATAAPATAAATAAPASAGADPEMAASVTAAAASASAASDGAGPESAGGPATGAGATAPAPSAGGSGASADADEARASASASGVSASASAGPSAAPSATPGGPSAGSGDCTLARGPARLGTTGAAVFGAQAGGLFSLGTNKEGAPAWESPRFPEPPRVTPGGALAPRAAAGSTALLPGPGPAPAEPAAAEDAAPERTRLPACAVAGTAVFCADGEGAIHRRPLSGGADRVVARGRKGTPVSAASVGGHTFYAFLANQKTTEGVIVRAFAALDDGSPVPISEDGSGATFVALVARDADVLAMYIDARTALTPVHARTLRAGSELERGADAVVFVGGGADSHVRGALGRGASGPALLFIPGDRDEKRFGVVAIPIDGAPKDDMSGVWSHYPAATSFPSLAATRGATPVRLLRSRPESADAGAPAVLELGHVAPSGAFQARCVLAKGGSFTDLAAAVDATGALWIAYTTSKGTWVEQRGAESKPSSK